MRAIPIEYVRPDSILGDTIFSNDGILLARKGIKLNTKLLEKINQNQIFTLYIDDEHSNAEVSRLLEPNIVNKSMILIKELFLAVGYRDSSGILKSKSIFDFVTPLNQMADEIIDELSSVRDNPLEYVNIKSIENYLYMSSLNCGILSALMAMNLSYNRDMIKQIFLAGIFHDVGMAMIPRDVFYKKGELVIEEKLMILNHPKSGHEYLKDKNFLSAYVKQATLQHHEKLDGSGYPNRTSGKEISQISQIIGIADIFDAMISDRPYSRATTPNEALEFLLGSAGRLFDVELIQLFTKKINPYPPGSLVKLSSGQVAVIDEVTLGLSLRPKIRLITGTKGAYQYKPVDLATENTLLIDSMIFQID